MQFSVDAKTIWQYLKPFKRTVWFILGVAIAGAVINAVIPLMYGRLVDLAMKKAAWQGIVGLIGGWFVFSLLSDYLSRLTDSAGDALSVRVSNSFLKSFLAHLIRLPFSFHKNQKMGRVLSRMNRAVFDLETIVTEAIFSTLPGFLTAIAILGILFYVHWLLACVLLLVLALYVAATLWRTQSIISAQKKMHQIYDKSFGDIWEAASNVQPIKAFAAEDFVME